MNHQGRSQGHAGRSCSKLAGLVNWKLSLFNYRAGGAGAAGAARAAPLLNSKIISSMGRGSAEPPKILLPYLQWPPHFSWASDAPALHAVAGALQALPQIKS